MASRPEPRAAVLAVASASPEKRTPKIGPGAKVGSAPGNQEEQTDEQEDKGRLDAVLKGKVALEALRNAATVAELGAKYQLHPAMTRAERVAMVDRGRSVDAAAMCAARIGALRDLSPAGGAGSRRAGPMASR